MVETNIFGDTAIKITPTTNIFGDTAIDTTTPFKEKKEDEDRAGYIASTAAGVISGLGKAAEGLTTLGTTLIDLGAGTELTEKVEKAFDEVDFLSDMEDLADDRWTGKMTEILVQLGAPGGIALKGANALIKAKKLGTLGRTAKRLPTVTRMAAVGGAELAAKTDDLGTLGDIADFALTEQRNNQGETGRREAIRNLENRFKFGLEGALGYGLFEKALIPFIKFGWNKAIPTAKGIITKSTGGADRVTSMVDEFRLVDEIDPVTQKPTGRKVKEKTGKQIPLTTQLQEGFQFNKNNILRAFDSAILSKVRKRGKGTEPMFKEAKQATQDQRAALSKANDIAQQLEFSVQEFIRPLGGALDNVELKQRDDLMASIYDYLTTPKDLQGKLMGNKIPPELMEPISKVRSHVDELSELFLKTKGGDVATDPFLRTVAANIGEYLARDYRAFGSQAMKDDWKNTLYNTPKGREVIEKAKVFIAEKNPNLGTIIESPYVGIGPVNPSNYKRFVPNGSQQADMMDSEIENILDTGQIEKLGNHLVSIKALDGAVDKARQKVPKEIRELLGEIKDPTFQLLQTSEKINKFISTSKYFQKVKDDGINKYFFPESTGGKLRSAGGQKFDTPISLNDPSNPLNNMYTTKDIANSLEHVSKINKKIGMFDGPIYTGLLLAPKAVIQEFKTTLSPITHFRNVSSALFFTGINGNLFNPAQFVKDISKSYKITKAMSKSQLETQAGRKLFKRDDEYQKFLTEYMEMQRLGIVNTSARLGDLKTLLDESAAGLEKLSTEGNFLNILSKFKQPGGVKRLREGARTLYSAEDDLYKIQNYFSEQSKYKKVWDKLIETDPNAFIKKYGQEASDKYGISFIKTTQDPIVQSSSSLGRMRNIGEETTALPKGDLQIETGIDMKAYNQFVKENAADIVRNNIPNYDYVPDFIKTLRKAPFGNFVSFPAEILRTGANTINQGVKEFADETTRGIGFQRLLGVGAFGLGSGKIIQEGAQLVTGVTNETINSLKEFLPTWSENSTIIPIKQGGQIYYMDYSHSNAYDFLTRPLRAAMNAIDKGVTDEKTLSGIVGSATYQAGKEFLQPFFSESIITEYYGDVFARGGKNKRGVEIWNELDAPGTKGFKAIKELLKRASPGSLKQIYRTYLSGVGSTQKYDRGYKFLNEASGLLGFRIQNPFIEQGLQFKITDNQKNTKAAKRIFEKVARDPSSSVKEIVKAYEKTNELKKESDKVLYRKLKAAENLGLSKAEINKVVGKRLSKFEFARIKNNKAAPLKVSDFIKKVMLNNSLLRNQPNPIPLFNRLSNDIYRSFISQDLFNNPEGIFDMPLELDIREEDRTPNIVNPTASDAYGANVSAVYPNRQPIVPTTNNNNQSSKDFAALINSSDRSQLAKSGNIDITEAIAERRT